ncbi:MAG: hypothetical protein RL660_1387 [Bacteroidota bacterium]|jgi:AAA+ ATPase superfamily predicted ATPase
MAITVNTKAPLVGRVAEIAEMQQLLRSKESELLAMFGRRRVGKTFLIKQVYQHDIVFQLTGLQKATKRAQLDNFMSQRDSFFKQAKNLPSPKNWMQAFEQLKKLYGKPRKKKAVIFFDEFPWLANGSSEFLSVFDNFWNTWAVDHNVLVVICGSAASWIINNVINDTGGLHNRVTKTIHLKPFTLFETEQFFTSRSINLPRKSIIELYMAFGGVPYYLKELTRGQTHVTAINKICFGKSAALHREFDNLYKALFKNHNKHLAVVRALAKKWKGLSRYEIIDITGLNSGGALTAILQDLEMSDFIQSYVPFGKKQRDSMYRLTDEFSLFYLRFVENNKTKKDYWLTKYNTPSVNAWKGYAFETLCTKHVDGIKRSLGIHGIYSQQCSFTQVAKSSESGFQIDLLIDRADNAINVCEIKYTTEAYTITAQDIEHWQQRLAKFRSLSKTRKQLFLTLIAANGVADNKHAVLVDKVLTQEALFDKDLELT